MVLEIPGTPYQIDTAHYSNGERWIDLWEGDKKIGGYKTLDDAIENIHTLCKVDEDGMAQLQAGTLE